MLGLSPGRGLAVEASLRPRPRRQVGGRPARRPRPRWPREPLLQVHELGHRRERGQGAGDVEDLPRIRSRSGRAARAARLVGGAAQGPVERRGEEVGVPEGVADAVPGDRVAVVAGVADQGPAPPGGGPGLVGQPHRRAHRRGARGRPAAGRPGRARAGDQGVERGGRRAVAGGGPRGRRAPACRSTRRLRRRGLGTRRSGRPRPGRTRCRPRAGRPRRRSGWRRSAAGSRPPARPPPGPPGSCSPSAPMTTRASTAIGRPRSSWPVTPAARPARSRARR